MAQASAIATLEQIAPGRLMGSAISSKPTITNALGLNRSSIKRSSEKLKACCIYRRAGGCQRHVNQPRGPRLGPEIVFRLRAGVDHDKQQLIDFAGVDPIPE